MSIVHIIYAILGISVIIFIHELGHFLAAKKVGVRVDRFSVGFDPTIFGIRLRLLSFTRGETEYVIGAVPFGGYVKMAGETPMDTSTEKTPSQAGWLISKTPGARALVFVAGAIFNIVSAFFFFAIAFSIGVSFFSTELGWVEPGSPAWKSGLRPGDEIVSIDDKPISEHMEIMMSVAFGDPGTDLEIGYTSPGSDTVRSVLIKPEWNAAMGLQTIGVRNAMAPKVLGVQSDGPAAAAGIERGDIVRGARLGSIEFVDLRSHNALENQIQGYLAFKPGEPIDLLVEGDGQREWRRIQFKEAEGTLNRLGVFSYTSSVIQHVQPGTTVAEFFHDGDRVLSINGQPVRALRTLDLQGVPDRGPKWSVEVERVDGTVESFELGRTEIIRATAHGEFRQAMLLEFGDVAADSPLGKAGIRTNDLLRSVLGRVVETPEEIAAALRDHSGAEVDVAVIRGGRSLRESITLPRDALEALGAGDAAAGSGIDNLWKRTPRVAVSERGYAQKIGMETGSRIVKIADTEITSWADLKTQVKNADADAVEIVWETPAGEIRSASTELSTKTYDHSLGLGLQPKQRVTKASLPHSAVLGIKRVKIIAQQVFLTLRGLVKRQVDAKNLAGPVGIVHIIYRISEYGLGTLIYFMALISVNLGILNLMPFPILDGGHLLFLLVEKIKGSPVNIRIQEFATTVAFFLIIGLALFVTYHDLRRLIGLEL